MYAHNTLPITVSIGDNQTFIYPDQFDNCNTNQAGVYIATLETEIGDPIITTFNVLSESIIGMISIIGSIATVFILYAKRQRV